MNLNILKYNFLTQLTTCAICLSLISGCSIWNNSRNLSTAKKEFTRKLPFDGANNFRDLGGYKTTDGYKVKWGKVYRSDKLSKLSDTDLDRMAGLGLKQVVDFRYKSEKKADPNRLPKNSGIVTLALPIDPRTKKVMTIYQGLQSNDQNIDPGEILMEVNRDFVRNRTAEYKTFIHTIADSNNLPLLFHCSAGKDRTGFGAAIILLALGVPEKTVMQDYILTNTYIREEVKKNIATWAAEWNISVEAMQAVAMVDERYLRTAFDTIKEDYGNIDNYLSEALKVDDLIRQKLRKNLLEQ